MRSFHFAAAFAVCSVACVVGCGGPSNPPTFPVTGIVTLDGTPVDGAVVSFVPHDVKGGSPAATGLSDASGKYALTTFVANDGAVPGQYDIKVTKFLYKDGKSGAGGAAAETEDAPPPQNAEEFAAAMKKSYEGKNPNAAAAPPKNVLPAKYESQNSSGLQFTVEKTGGSFDIKLTKK